MVAGKEASPKDVQNTERLMRYWAEGQGSLAIRWGTEGDYQRCLDRLTPYVGEGQVHGLCANLHHRALGIWPATHAKLDRAGHGNVKPGKH